MANIALGLKEGNEICGMLSTRMSDYDLSVAVASVDDEQNAAFSFVIN